MKCILFWIYVNFFALCATGQNSAIIVLSDIDTSKIYLFYLHGQIAIENGKGISKYFGVYEYQNILDTFSSYGYKVISEPRPINADDGIYSIKVSNQIDTLLKAGVKPSRVVVVGASA